MTPTNHNPKKPLPAPMPNGRARPVPAAPKPPQAHRTAPAPAEPRKVKARKARPRLPDGSRVSACYDGGSVRWTGRLEIPVGEGWKTFSGTTHVNGGIMGLLVHLDNMYRRWLRATPEPEIGGAA